MKSLHPILLELISVLVKNNIEVTFKNDSKTDQIILDLNTQTKSGVYLLPTELGFTILTRYDSVGEEFDLTDENIDSVIRNLCYTVKINQCGRDYCNQYWLDLMVEYKVIKKHIETKVIYS